MTHVDKDSAGHGRSGAAAQPGLEPEAGPTWEERARLQPLAAVLDPADLAGHKNVVIDRTHRHALTRALGSVRQTRVLDFGCGNGRLSGWLVARGARVIGVDASEAMVDSARLRVPGARFEAIDGMTLPVEDESMDLVLSVGVLLYSAHDPNRLEQLFSEFVRVLRPEGRLIAIEQVHDGSLGRGGTKERYLASMSAAGLSAVKSRPVRLGDSRVQGFASRSSRLADLPGVPRLIATEAWLRRRGPFVGQRYADFLFAARKL